MTSWTQKTRTSGTHHTKKQDLGDLGLKVVRIFRPEKLRDFFFVPRGCVILFCPKKLHDFFCSKSLRDIFIIKGCVIFLSSNNAFFCPERLRDFFFVLRDCMIFFVLRGYLIWFVQRD